MAGSAKTLNDLKPPPPPKVKEVRLSEEGLREVVLQLGKRIIVVSEEDYFSEYRMGSAVNELLETPLPDAFTHAMTLNLLPPLLACSYGDVPKPEEFSHMGRASIKLWIEKARELNPGVNWFTFLDELEREAIGDEQAQLAEETKKKEQP